MTFAMRERTDIQRQRGFWLRCFLSGAFLLVLFCSAAFMRLHAQLDIEGPVRLTHVAGRVVNTLGVPVANVEVTLSQDDKVVFSTRTDQSGAFKFENVSGKFWFRVARSEYAPAAREVIVRPEIVSYLKRTKLYVIVGPGACMDECSSVFTSKSEFEHAIRKYSRQ